MTTIFELVNDALATLSPAIPFAVKPYQGDPLPDTFIDFQLVEDGSEQHADNAETERSYTVQVSTWSVDGLVSLPDVDTAMVAAGFQKGPRRQLPSDPQTGHFGVAQDYVYF